MSNNDSTKLKNGKVVIPTSKLGIEDFLPNLQSHSAIHEKIAWDETLEPSDYHYFGYGRVDNILPYTIQDNYNRIKQDVAYRTIVLENNILRATFLPELGGRLWSIYHKRSKRELLYCNPVIQLGNLALRNAWFSGGVEWNIGMKGHSPFTCEPLFIEIFDLPDGTPVLRMYEWERKRQCTFQIEAYLPKDSELLFVKVRIVNTLNNEIPMYWWSNIAVPETQLSRVLIPAKKGLYCRYRNGNYEITKIELPYYNDVDISYPTNLINVMDLFYDTSENDYNWMTCLDKNGIGLIHFSTERLMGRKLFVWGMGDGSRHWQEFLSIPQKTYIELQAGLAKTQLECKPMEPNGVWEWEEAYGLIECEPDIIHDLDYYKVLKEVNLKASTVFSKELLNEEFETRGKEISNFNGKIIQYGSGWGALEILRRKEFNEQPFKSNLLFPEDSINEKQELWLNLLKNNSFLGVSITEKSMSFMIQKEWHDILEKAVKDNEKNNWFSWYHLGIMRYANGGIDGSKTAFEKSFDLQPTKFSLRALGLMAYYCQELETACMFYQKAIRIDNNDKTIAVEYARILIEAQKPNEWLEVFDSLSSQLRCNGRIKYYTAMAYTQLEEFFKAEKILYEPLVIADIKEGELSLYDLVFKIIEGKERKRKRRELTNKEKDAIRKNMILPYDLDFRMNID